MLEWINIRIVEWVGEPMTRKIDDDRAVVVRERRKNRRPIEAASQTSMYQQQRRARAKFQQLGLAMRPAQPPHARAGRNPRTGKEVRIPPGRTIRFKPGKDLQNIS
jgi:DNA-binding protein HU-beta